MHEHSVQQQQTSPTQIDASMDVLSDGSETHHQRQDDDPVIHSDLELPDSRATSQILKDGAADSAGMAESDNETNSVMAVTTTQQPPPPNLSVICVSEAESTQSVLPGDPPLTQSPGSLVQILYQTEDGSTSLIETVEILEPGQESSSAVTASNDIVAVPDDQRVRLENATESQQADEPQMSCGNPELTQTGNGRL